MPDGLTLKKVYNFQKQMMKLEKEECIFTEKQTQLTRTKPTECISASACPTRVSVAWRW